jgi:hypothetical protein
VPRLLEEAPASDVALREMIERLPAVDYLRRVERSTAEEGLAVGLIVDGLDDR